MFDWFKKDKAPSNVVPFPEPKEAPKIPYVVPPVPEPEKPATIFYRFGVTDNNRLSFSMGYSEITMNKQGVQNLINQLEHFKSYLEDDND